jgi:uncharacterized protein (DUF885 family)
MTREEAIKYYLSNISDSEEGATAAIERYMAIPGQALGYKIGSLKILELRAKYQKQLGNKFNLAKFHDEILNQGCLPLSVLERKMELWAKKQKVTEQIRRVPLFQRSGLASEVGVSKKYFRK